MDVLEEAWALRSSTVGQRAEESVARVEQEVQKLWRQVLKKEGEALSNRLRPKQLDT